MSKVDVERNGKESEEEEESIYRRDWWRAEAGLGPQ